MSTAAMKITSKGQVTIPKEIRKLLKSAVVNCDVVQSNVVIRPVLDTAGSLSEYAKNVKAGSSFKRLKDKSWEEVIRKKTGKKASG